MRKHLIVLVDGTWVAAQDGKLSNIFRLNQLLNNKNGRGEPQIVFYVRGLGTGLQDTSEGLLGKGVQTTVEEIYVDLCSNYVRGDTITLVGFSRGGMLARSVAGLIARVGLLKPESIDLIDEAICEYLSIGGLEVKRARRKRLSRALIRDVRVDFLGAFDCVASVLASDRENDRGRLISFADKKVARNVRRAVQILALDETRRNFEAELWSGTSTRSQRIEQIWMPGIHSDIGGTGQSRWLGDVALLKMIERMKLHAPFLSFSGSMLAKLKRNIANTPAQAPSINGGISSFVLEPFGGPRDYARGIPAQFIHRLFKSGKVTLPKRKTRFLEFTVRAAFLELPPL